MNKLAEELNKKLTGSVALDLLSDLGKNFYFPKGIAAQAAEAKAGAHRFNATIGMAFNEGKPMVLPSIRTHIQGMDPVEIVSYAPTGGVDRLRKQWKAEIIKKNPGLKDENLSLPAVVSGLTNGITQISDLFAGPGDSIITSDMFWGNYRLIFEVRREAKIHTFPFFNDQQKINAQGMTQCIRDNAQNKKAVLLLNFPNNPTGYSPTESEAQAMAEALEALAEEGYKLLVVCDDAYFGLFFEDDIYTSSFFNKIAQLHENILGVKIDGPTKEDFVWGFRLGFVTFSGKGVTEEQLTALNQKLTGSIRATISNSSRTSQSLLLSALKNPNYEEEKNIFFQILKERYVKVKEILKGLDSSSPLKPLPFNSGYFMTFQCDGIDAEELRLNLLKEGIGTISIQDTYLRVAFSSIDTKDLEALYERIFAVADQLKK